MENLGNQMLLVESDQPITEFFTQFTEEARAVAQQNAAYNEYKARKEQAEERGENPTDQPPEIEDQDADVVIEKPEITLRAENDNIFESPDDTVSAIAAIKDAIEQNHKNFCNEFKKQFGDERKAYTEALMFHLIENNRKNVQNIINFLKQENDYWQKILAR